MSKKMVDLWHGKQLLTTAMVPEGATDEEVKAKVLADIERAPCCFVEPGETVYRFVSQVKAARVSWVMGRNRYR